MQRDSGVELINLDGIIFTLQKHGGISVYMRELFNRSILAGIDIGLLLFDKQAMSRFGEHSQRIMLSPRRCAERYRRCRLPVTSKLFHSSYYRLPQSQKIPSIITVYDFTYEHFSSGVRRYIHSAQKFKAIREATAVICISENTRKDVLELVPGVAPDKVRVIRLAAGDSFFPLAAQSDSWHQRPFVLFIGSRVWYKNFEAAVNSITSLKDFDLVCVGGGAFTESERKILEGSISGRYRHEGFINDERLNYLYNTAVCLLYPSTYEGFGIPVLEAMSAGCPVIALNMSSIPEVAGEAAILLEAAESGVLKQAIEHVTDRDFRLEVRQKGMVQAQSFSWDHTVNQTIKVYEEVLGYTLPRKEIKETGFE